MPSSATLGPLGRSFRLRTTAVVVVTLLAATLMVLFGTGALLWNTLERETLYRLTAVRSFAEPLVLRDLQRSEQMLQTFAQRDDTAPLFQSFARALNISYRNDVDVSSWTEALERYYAADLAQEYFERRGETFLEHMVLSRLSPTTIQAQYRWIADNPNAIGRKVLMETTLENAEYSRLHALWHGRLATLATSLNAEDVLLVSPDGTVVYSTGKRAEFATSLADGPWRNSLAGEAFRVLASKGGAPKIWLTDVAPYTPAGGRMSAFLGVPVTERDTVLGYVLVRFSDEFFYTALTDHLKVAGSGLDVSGDVYLIGPDGLLRSPSRLARTETERLVERLASLVPDSSLARLRRWHSDVGMYPMTHVAARKVLAGEEGVVAMDDAGVPSWASYVPIQLLNQRWGLIVRIDRADVVQRFWELNGPLVLVITLLALAMLVFVGLVNAWLGERVFQRIRRVAARAQQAMQGRRQPEVEQGDELERLENAVTVLSHAAERRAEPTAPKPMAQADAQALHVHELFACACAVRETLAELAQQQLDLTAQTGGALAPQLQEAAQTLQVLAARAHRLAQASQLATEDRTTLTWFEQVRGHQQGALQAVADCSDIGVRLAALADSMKVHMELSHLQALNASLSEDAPRPQAPWFNLRDIMMHWGAEMEALFIQFDVLRRDAMYELTQLDAGFAASPLLAATRDGAARVQQHDSIEAELPNEQVQALCERLQLAAQGVTVMQAQLQRVTQTADRLVAVAGVVREDSDVAA